MFGTLSYHDIPRMGRMLLMWKVFRCLSCLAYVVHISLPYSSVLMTQVLYTAILVLTVSLGLIHTYVVRCARVLAAFLIFLLISTSRERLSASISHNLTQNNKLAYSSTRNLQFNRFQTLKLFFYYFSLFISRE